MSTEKEPAITTNELDTNLPETISERRRRIAIMAGLSIALTLAATWGANKANENRIHPMPQAVTYEMPTGRIIGVDAGVDTYDIIPGEGGTIRLPGVEVGAGIKEPDTASMETTEPAVDVQQMEWARRFDSDPDAKRLNPNAPKAIEGAAEKVHKLEADGWRIDQITIQGFASDEGDDRQGDNPGFGMPTNEKNIKLANKRATTVSEIFEQKLEDDSANADYPIVTKEGEEVRDDELAAQIEAEAQKLGMDTDDLVVQFNRDPESLPAEAREVLSGLYGDRFVRIEIEASREVTVPGEETTGSIILIPILIPIFKRHEGPTPVAPPSEIPIETEEDERPKFPHPPRKIGDVNPGHARMAQRIKQPDTSNAHFGKGSGGKVSAYRGTHHRGNHH